MKKFLLALWPLVSAPALGHHGVAGVGAAALEGPGAPVESASSAVLPEGGTLLALKIDHARYRTFDPQTPEADHARYGLLGMGHGFTPWFSGYLFLPHHLKVDEAGGFTTQGWTDLVVLAQLGFRHDGQALTLMPKNESLDEQEDWHFTVFGGLTLPTGRPNLRLPDGSIDPGKSTGLGKSSYTVGATATKMISPKTTFNAELSTLWFRSYRYAADEATGRSFDTRFGRELRVNGGLAYRLHTDSEAKLRSDFSFELQYLRLGRDVVDARPEPATGGRVLYALPGLRLYWQRLSLAMGIKKALWKKLNEQAQQQGAEGQENYRLVLNASLLF